MNWKIICLMIVYYIELISSGQSSRSSEETTWRQTAQEMMLEELYDKNVFKSLNYVSTLIKLGIVLDNNDINLLSSECVTSLSCENKKVSIEKYHTLMKAILRINKDYMSIIFDNILTLIHSGEKSSLDMLVKHYFSYVPRILSLLYAARWEAPKWQVKFFIYLSALISMDLKSFDFDFVLMKTFEGEHFELALLETLKEDRKKNTGNANDILLIIEKLYKNDELQNAYKNEHHMTAHNLMLFHLYGNHEAYTQNSKLEIYLDWKWVNSVFIEISSDNKFAMANQLGWSLIQHRFIRYHVLLLNCIQVRVMFYAWYHVKLSIKMLSQYKNVKNLFKNPFTETQVLQYWYSLIDPLKHIMRIFSIKDNILWIALRKMMDDITKFKINEIDDLEMDLRNEFLSIVKELDLGEVKTIDQQLKTLSTVKSSNEIIEKIKANSNHLKSYTSYLQEMLTPINVSSVGWFFEKYENIFYSNETDKRKHNIGT